MKNSQKMSHKFDINLKYCHCSYSIEAKEA